MLCLDEPYKILVSRSNSYVNHSKVSRCSTLQLPTPRSECATQVGWTSPHHPCQGTPQKVAFPGLVLWSSQLCFSCLSYDKQSCIAGNTCTSRESKLLQPQRGGLYVSATPAMNRLACPIILKNVGLSNVNNDKTIIERITKFIRKSVSM